MMQATNRTHTMPAPHEDIASLVGRAQAGDEDAWFVLVPRMQRKVLALCTRLGVPRKDMSDLIQETWAKVFTNIDRLDDPGNFEGWFFRVAYRMVVNHIRHKSAKMRSARKTLSLNWRAAGDEDERYDPMAIPSEDRRFGDVDDRELVDCLLSRLHHREAKVIRLAYGIDGGGERTPSEIGRHYGVSRQRAHQLEMRGMETIRRIAVQMSA